MYVNSQVQVLEHRYLGAGFILSATTCHFYNSTGHSHHSEPSCPGCRLLPGGAWSFYSFQPQAGTQLPGRSDQSDMIWDEFYPMPQEQVSVLSLDGRKLSGLPLPGKGALLGLLQTYPLPSGNRLQVLPLTYFICLLLLYLCLSLMDVSEYCMPCAGSITSVILKAIVVSRALQQLLFIPKLTQ